MLEAFEPLCWMGQTLAFVILAASLGVWRQVATAAGMRVAGRADWDAMITAMWLAASARFALGLSGQLDSRMKATQWPGEWMGPFEMGAVALAGLGLASLWPLFREGALRAGSGVVSARLWSMALLALASGVAIGLARGSASFVDLCAGLQVATLSAGMAGLSSGKGAAMRRMRLVSALGLAMALAFGVAGLGTPGAAGLAAAALGSLIVLVALHMRVRDLSRGRVNSSPWRAARHWAGSWMILLGVGPALWLASGREDGLFRDYAMTLGLLCAFVTATWHFRDLNLAVARYLDRMARERSRALLSGIDAAAFLLGRGDRVMECSKAAEGLVGMEARSMEGKSVWEALKVAPIEGFGRFEARDEQGRLLVLTKERLGEAEEGLAALTARDSTGETAALEALDRAAREDELTGLPNRREALSIVDLSISRCAEGEGLGVLFLDLDHFKNVNDTEGHAAGDALLREVAGLLGESLRENGGWLARLGGDEFLGVIPSGGEVRCEEAAFRCIEAMERSQRATQGSVGVSVGIALFPRDGANGADLIRRADAAMYEAKTGGRGRLSFFGAAIESRLRRRVQVEGFLREALKRDEGLSVALQPMCSMEGLFLGRAEALVRAPGMPGLGAQEMVDVAEASGLILPLGRWVLRQAGAIQRDADKAGVALTLSINVSARQFMDDLFWEQFRGMARLGQFTHGVTLEVTESTLMEDAERSCRLLMEARALGASIALDDFGAGYSSLSTLKTMPLDKLKMDKSLLDMVPEEEGASRVAQAAIAIADALRLEVVAEGVEREDQARWLKSKGVYVAQGYLFAKPMEPERLLALAGSKGAAFFHREPREQEARERA
jgi:diguanylate cyclase (GGDEF)-like protein